MDRNRYNIPGIVKKLDSGKKVYSTIFYPKIDFYVDDIYIFAKQGDRLDLLSYRYYKDSTLWWIIAHANKIKGTMIVPNDMQIRIPSNINDIYNKLLELNK